MQFGSGYTGLVLQPSGRGSSLKPDWERNGGLLELRVVKQCVEQVQNVQTAADVRTGKTSRVSQST